MTRMAFSKAYLSVMLAIGIVAAGASRIRYNETPSIPVGIYYVTGSAPSVGDYVIFCSDARPAFEYALRQGFIARGTCPGGGGRLFKRILAAKADQYIIDPSGITINGHKFPFAAKMDETGVPPSIGEGSLGQDEFLVFGDHPLSFDSRYFGVIHRRQIESVVRPLYLTQG